MFDDVKDTATRRLPIYLVVDTSGSMAGDKMTGVNQGMQMLHQSLMDSPQAVETVDLAVITFSSGAKVIEKRRPITQFEPIPLNAEGQTALGQAIDLLNEQLDKDHAERSKLNVRDYKTLVFIFTDGQPTDNYKEAANRLKNRSYNKPGSIVVLAMGSDHDINEAVLRDIGTVMLRMRDVTSDKLKSFFQWVSQSAQMVAKSAAQGQEGANRAPEIPQDAGIELII